MKNFRIVEIKTRDFNYFFPQKRFLWIWWDLTYEGLLSKEEAESRIKKDKFIRERKIHFVNEYPKEKCWRKYCKRDAVENGQCQTHLDSKFGF